MMILRKRPFALLGLLVFGGIPRLSLCQSPRDATPVDVATTKTLVSSETLTTVTRPGWVAPSVVTIIATKTLTSLVPWPADPAASYPLTLDDTVISRATYETRMTYSDGHSSTLWSSATHTYSSTAVFMASPPDDGGG